MVALGRWEALIRVPSGGSAVSATNSGGGPTTVTITQGDYYYTAVDAYASILTTFETALNASRPNGWTVSISTGASGTGKVTINCTQTPWSLSWTSTELRDLLGFTANITSVSSAQTGTKQARGLWFPDCPLAIAGHPSMAPKVPDLTTVTTPTGAKFGFVSIQMFRHRGLEYSHIPEARFRESAVTIANASLEQFLADTQHGDGLSFFDVTSLVQIYWGNAGSEVALGIDGNGGVGVGGWQFEAPSIGDLVQSSLGFTGLWRFAVDELTSAPEV